jgi:hypothetical protein
MQSIRNQQDAEVWREIEAASDRVLAIVSIKDGRVVDRQAGGFRQLPDELSRARASISG